MTYEKARDNYMDAAVKGILAVMSKMGISTVHSYHGAQIFEAVGIKQDLINKYFCNTPSRIEGIGITEIARENALRHETAYGSDDALERGDFYQYHKGGQLISSTPKRSACCRRPARKRITISIRNMPSGSIRLPSSASATFWNSNIPPAAAFPSKKSNRSTPSSSGSAPAP